MRLLPQIIIALLIWLIVIGTIFNPELRTYSTQLIALLVTFYIVLKHLIDREQKEEKKVEAHTEEELLFLATYVKPKVERISEIVENDENHDIAIKQLALLKREIENYIKRSTT